MPFYKIEFSNKEGNWVVKKRGNDYTYRRVSNSSIFPTIEEAENWIRETVSEHVLIDHKIEGYSGHLMKIQEWQQACDDGFLIDYDGHGVFVDDQYAIIQNCKSVRPSDYTHYSVTYPDNANYILWFNR